MSNGSSDIENWKIGSTRDSYGRFLSLWLEGNLDAGGGILARPDISKTLSWVFTRSPPSLPKLGEYVAVKPDWQKISATKGSMKCTWIGHATCFLQLTSSGRTVLTDPIFSHRCSPIQWVGPERFVPTACSISELPRVDVVVISHNHYDHLDTDSIVELEKIHRPYFVCGLGLGEYFRSVLPKVSHSRIVELDWWQEIELFGEDRCGAMKIHFVPVQHWSKRWVWGDELKSLWGGYFITGPAVQGERFFFNGDTGYSKKLYTELGRRCGPVDMAAIPIGAYDPRSVMAPQHVDPEQALKIHQHISSRHR